MIVTSEGRTLDALNKDPGYSLFSGIAHEIGHFWWSFGTGQGDWINETFAEYFSLIAEQKISTNTVRYYKGSLMLDYFRNLLGNEKFFKICREFYQKFNQTEIGMAEFRSFWGEKLGVHKKELNIWLDSKGGIPAGISLK
jgi:hypothetical protein